MTHAKGRAGGSRAFRLRVLLAVLLAGAPLAVRAQTVEHATRERVMAALPPLEEMARQFVDRDDVPGLSVAVVHRDEVVFLKGFGVRDEAGREPVDADTVFQLASLSKPLAATVVAALVGEGAVSWDARIADIDPGFRLREAYPSAQVTVRDLFCHRSGLPGSAGNELEGLGYDRDTILHRLRLVELSSSFRAGYSYSNFGLTAGAVAAAKAAGLSWEDAAETRLYRPLGMASTSSRHADFVARPNRATLHVRDGGGWKALSRRDPDAQSPAGGASSSARDLAQWVRLQLGSGKFDGRQLIDAHALGQTHQPHMWLGRHPITGSLTFYGLGWNVEYGRYGEVWGHAGAFSEGARTLVSLLPGEQLGIVVLANAFPTGAPEALADSFFDLVMRGDVTRDWKKEWDRLYEQVFGQTIEEAARRYGTPPASPQPALPAAAYVGVYANPYVGRAVVAEADGTLQIRLGPEGKWVVPLRHFDRDLFTYRPFPEMPDLMSSATFSVGPDGRASAVTLEHLHDLGLGVLKRVEEPAP
jgi:CubicO group peptidase (beta-lactamase class C family)